jgi:hypothetical protein
MCRRQGGVDHQKRRAAIKLRMRIVQNLAARLVWQGQKTYIEKDDLVSVGMIQALRTIDTHQEDGFPLDKSIARDAKTIMLRFMNRETRERKYRVYGGLKAKRDAGQGNQAGNVDGGRDDDLTPTKIPISARMHDLPNTDDFTYRGWLRGSSRMGRDEFGYYFPEVEDPKCELPSDLWAFHARPVIECLGCTRTLEPERDSWGHLVDPAEERERERAGLQTIVCALAAARLPYSGPLSIYGTLSATSKLS